MAEGFGRSSSGYAAFGWPVLRGLLALVAALIFLPLVTACSEKAEDKPKVEMPPLSVGVVEVAARPTNPGKTFVGRVEAIDNVNLMARVDGFLTRREFTEGQMVKAGDLLFVIQKDVYEASVVSAQANLEKAQADANNQTIQANRARLLIKTDAVSRELLDDRIAAEKQGMATVAQAKAALDQAKINLGYTDIHAPFDGRIGITNFSIGALVGPSSGSLATIVSQDPIYVTFPVSDRTILEFTHGDRASATTKNIAIHLKLGNNMAYPQTGTIEFTGIKVDPNTDTVTIRAKFPNPKNTLLDGQFVQVFAESKAPVEALVVPQKAVLTDQSGNYVMVVEAGNKVAQRPITQGQTVGSDVVVQSGLKKGDVVISDGLQRIRPGQVVDPEPVGVSVPAGGAVSPVGD
ncbi:efflux RND transporter periplasmic adaptor subunit [Rhizobium sp. KVB221]|uniref:Efflux RND transporter periplasmic adaptor subunit n=2 Tax=Rhizobium setariae TaxID=2801340 RepID=A0A937CL52_9HYPH|nr:efflux RND transporter periplasmic adaptor subunit [Rhizobium setariae]